MSRDILNSIINDFNPEKFARFFREKNRSAFAPRKEELLHYNDEDFKNGLKLGEIAFTDAKLFVCTFQVSSRLSERSGKKAQYEKAKKILKNHQEYSAGIFVFYDANGNFRFSLIYDIPHGNKRDWSNFRRFTYFVSKEFTNKTFLKQIGESDFSSLEKIKDAFSVEKVTKEFFKEYEKLFKGLVEELKKNHTFINEAARYNIDTENFAKKLLGQIVFIYFLQKKGWLGASKDKLLKDGNRNFLWDLFEKKYKEYNNFFNDVLEHLFYDALNRKSDKVGTFYRDYFKCQIPFLNGGLFEPEYEWKESQIYLDDEIFKQILETFNSYNFTVDENSPTDQEIAIDPEMLGKIFENLLSENLRKGKGTYYTPREIVHYMCQQSLINYLYAEHKPSPQIAKEDIKSLIKYSEEKNYSQLSQSIQKNAKLIDEKLASIKVCDPACGSGAFLVGMLHEIINTRMFLDKCYLNQNKSEYQLKKEAIQDCIYGVDIDPGAIEIAKLRLWLSLVVDYELEEIEPLPNLDYKIMQGNSLLEEFEGIKFYEEENETLFRDKEREEKTEKLRNKKLKYFSLSDSKDKDELKQEISGLIDWFVKSLLEKEKQKITNLRRMEKGKLNQLRSQKDRNVYWNQWADKFSKEGKINELLKKIHDPKTEKPFFLWKLNFMEVFEEKGGFDVVIANPPYVEHKKLKEISNILRDKFKTYSGTADLYVYFYEVALNILRKKGVLAFISSNKFIKARYGANLRTLLAENRIYNIVDFTKVQIFDALVASCIVLVSKDNPANKIIVTFTDDTFVDNLDEFIKSNYIKLSSMSLGGDIWQLEDSRKLKIKEQIEVGSKKLGEINGINIYRGITTGYNPAFVIDEDAKDRLIKKDRKSAEVIKDLLQGRNIKKWFYNESHQYLLQTGFDRNIKSDFPVVYSHLSNYEKELKKRDDQGRNWWNLRACKYYTYFEKEKIVWGLTADKWAFAYDDKKHYLPSNGYILTSKSKLTAKYLLTLLNSTLLKFYFGFIGIMTAGGAYTLKHETIRMLPVKEITKIEQQSFVDLVDKILALTKSTDNCQLKQAVAVEKQAKVKDYERQIDQMVYKLYGLTDKEIAIVKESIVR